MMSKILEEMNKDQIAQDQWDQFFMTLGLFFMAAFSASMAGFILWIISKIPAAAYEAANFQLPI